ncbi:MAG: endonuclease/exonuclease/phosphatase family protein [Bacteroidota bacterium]
MIQKLPFIAFLILAFAGPLMAQQYPYKAAFYNVENLFDIEDHPEKKDEDFTPEGRQKWDKERYETKLDRIAEVFENLEFPELIGLCEVENEEVCIDLILQSRLKDQGYSVAHLESPDVRGIDNALLYKKDLFQVKNVEGIRIDYPEGYLEEEDYTTRDVLIVKGTFKKKYDLTILVNHWPSRRGGLSASEPKRTFVAEHVGQYLDNLYAENPNQRVIVMGDFNDEPANKSIQVVLRASMDDIPDEGERLINLMGPLDEAEKGSYNYRGNWNMLDQIMISPFLTEKKSKFQFGPAEIFMGEFLIYEHDRFGKMPNRTYGGPNYYGGYSDHFAVYVPFKAK